jgi:D-alanyl-lipoteichoic acid acyltransferase DltB (MBOAT superfamily)
LAHGASFNPSKTKRWWRRWHTVFNTWQRLVPLGMRAMVHRTTQGDKAQAGLSSAQRMACTCLVHNLDLLVHDGAKTDFLFIF